MRIRSRMRSVVLWGLLMGPLLVMADCVATPSRLVELQALVQTRYVAQDALVLVRRSAQDFKNLLLRSADPVQAQMLRLRFERNALSYEQRLATLQSLLSGTSSERERASLLVHERVALFEGYQQALKTHDVRRIEQALVADKAVQGADVKTFRALEITIENLNAQIDAEFQTLRVTLQSCAR